MSGSIPYIGSKISLISKSESRYEGILYSIDTEKSTVALQNVRSFGTEGRRKDGEQIAPMNDIYDYIIFKVSDIKDLYVCEAPPPQPMYGGFNYPPMHNPMNPQQQYYQNNPSYGNPYANYGSPFGYGSNPYQSPTQPLQNQVPSTSALSSTSPARPNVGATAPVTTPPVSSVPHVVTQTTTVAASQPVPSATNVTSVPPKKEEKSALPPAAISTPPRALAPVSATSSFPAANSSVVPPHLQSQNLSQNLTSQVSTENALESSVDNVTNQLGNTSLNNQNGGGMRGGRRNNNGNNNFNRNQGNNQNNNQNNQNANSTNSNNNRNNNNRRQNPNQNNQNSRTFAGTSSTPSKFTEDFDFESANSRFEKEKSSLVAPTSAYEASEEDLEALTPPAYEKSSFFDNISCEATDRLKDRSNRSTLSEQRKLDAETFGASSRSNRGRGGPRRYNSNPSNNSNNSNNSSTSSNSNRGRNNNFRQSDGRPQRKPATIQQNPQ